MAFDYAGDGMFVHELLEGGRPGTFIEVNDYGCRMSGYSREELLELTPMDIDRMPPETAREMMDHLARNSQITFESTLVTKKGNEIPVEISNYVVSKGKRDIIVAIVRDITERKEAENKLIESEEKYRNLFESATDIIFILDLEGHFIDVNRMAQTKLGYTKDEMLSLHISQFDPPEFADRVPERLAQIKDKGVAVFESANIKKDGTVMPVEVNSRLIEYEGKQVYFSIVRDITERKKSEKMLSDSHQRFNTVLDGLHSYVYVTTMDTYEILFVNKPILEQFGDIVGKKCWKIFHVDKSGPCEDCPSNVLIDVNGNPAGEVMREDFNEQFGRWYELCDRAIRWVDGSIVRMGLVSDITERKEAESKLRGALKEKEVLLQEIHHRVKNNMAIISALLQLQARYSRDENVTLMFRDSQSRISSMALVHEKLYQTQDFININFREYVEELVRHIMNTYGMKEGEMGLELSIDNINLNIDTMIPCGLILNELVTNSLKHAFDDIESSEIKISLNEDDGQAALVYSDNGKGIPEHIEFPNSDSLGLQIVSMLSLQLKGTVQLERDEGTRFTIEFKLTE